MAVEMISSIRKTEAKAAHIRREAQSEAKALLAKAADDAAIEAEAIEKRAYEAANAVREDAEREMKRLTEAQNRSFSERSAKLRENAENRLAHAADYILKELFAL